MWLMAQAIDTLRSGNIARTADLLSGHFLAAHQALLDQSWSQAKYLEVAQGEEANATSAAVLLEARKHAKASFKVETPDAWYPQKGWHKGWSNSYKGGGSWQGEKSKGKGKKGSKYKERTPWQDKEGKGKNKWKESQDKEKEKD